MLYLSNMMLRMRIRQMQTTSMWKAAVMGRTSQIYCRWLRIRSGKQVRLGKQHHPSTRLESDRYQPYYEKCPDGITASQVSNLTSWKITEQDRELINTAEAEVSKLDFSYCWENAKLIITFKSGKTITFFSGNERHKVYINFCRDSKKPKIIKIDWPPDKVKCKGAITGKEIVNIQRQIPLLYDEDMQLFREIRMKVSEEKYRYCWKNAHVTIILKSGDCIEVSSGNARNQMIVEHDRNGEFICTPVRSSARLTLHKIAENVGATADFVLLGIPSAIKSSFKQRKETKKLPGSGKS